MQICDFVSPHRSAGRAPGAARAKFTSKHVLSARLPKRARANAADLAEYVDEDLAQTLCAEKVRLELLAELNSPGRISLRVSARCDARFARQVGSRWKFDPRRHRRIPS